MSDTYTFGMRLPPTPGGDSRRRIAEALLRQGTEVTPVRHWTQGLARIVQAMMGGYELNQEDQTDKARVAKAAEDIANFPGATPLAKVDASPASGEQPAQPPQSGLTRLASALGSAPGSNASVPEALVSAQQPMQAPAPVNPQPMQAPSNPTNANAIASIESGGKYDLLGPVIARGHSLAGDRAYGKYQVMGSNVGPWTKQYFGQELTPAQFVANPAAQDAVFQGEFGRLAQKYGPEGAARAWFAGEGGMNQPGRTDQLGTSVANYGSRFAAATGVPTSPPAQMAPGGAGSPSVATAAPGAQYPAGGRPMAAPTAAAGIDPAMASYIQRLTRNPDTAGFGIHMLQTAIASGGVSTVDLGNAVGIMDKRGNLIRMIPKGEPNKGPEFGKIGSQNGEEVMGWRDPRNQTVTPYALPAASSPSTASAPNGLQIPAAPPGADAKTWRDTYTQQVAKSESGGMLPATAQETAELRKEIRQLPSYQNYAQAFPIYRSMKETAGRDSKASDLNLVYGLGKIFDPNSVVREGEMVMVKNTASLPDWVVGAINALNGGAGLQPATRQAILREAYTRMKVYENAAHMDLQHYHDIASRNRMNPLDVVPAFEAATPYEPPDVPPPPTVEQPPPGAYTWDPNRGMQRK